MKRNLFNFFFKAPIYFGKQIAQGTKWLWLTFSTFIFRSFRFLKSSFQGILNILNVVIALLALFVGYEAMVLSQKAIQQSDEQFKRNSEESELQAQRAREQYDSAMVILGNYQKLSQQSLETSKKQAVTARRILDDQIYSGRPYFAVPLIEISDTNKYVFDLFAPNISIYVVNSGKRAGSKFQYKTAIVFLDRKEIRSVQKSHANPIAGGGGTAIQYLPKILKSHKNDFFLYVELSYFDDVLNQEFNHKYYFDYYKMREKFDFWACSSDQQRQIDTLVNELNKVQNYVKELPLTGNIQSIK